MARLTKAQRQALDSAVSSLQWALHYLHSDGVAVCTVSRQATSTLHMQRAFDDKVFVEIDKYIGSPLAGFETALSVLFNLSKQQ